MMYEDVLTCVRRTVDWAGDRGDLIIASCLQREFATAQCTARGGKNTSVPYRDVGRCTALPLGSELEVLAVPVQM